MNPGDPGYLLNKLRLATVNFYMDDIKESGIDIKEVIDTIENEDLALKGRVFANPNDRL